MDGFEINKFLMLETGTYNAPAHRPYKTTMNQDIQNLFVDKTEGCNDVRAGTLAGIAGSILKPTPQPQGMVNIDNGWNTRRFRFMLELTIQQGSGIFNKEIVAGYTDHADVSFNNNIDPQTRLFFNSTLTLKDTFIMNTGAGNQRIATVSNSSHVLVKPQYENPTLSVMDLRHSMRPEDVIAVMHSQSASKMDNDVMDHRTTFLKGGKKSARGNCLPTQYMSRIMTELQTAAQIDGSQLADAAKIYDDARSGLREPLLMEDSFFHVIGRNTTFNQTGYITYADLCRLFPEADSRCLATVRGQTQQVTATMATNPGENWTVTSNEVVVATILSHAVPAIMTELLMTKVTFAAHNRTTDGRFFFQFRKALGFSEGIDLSKHCQHFEHRIISELLMDITKQNTMDIAILMAVDALGDTYVTVSINGQPDVEFVTPSFCDAMMTPVIAQGNDYLANMSTDMENLFHAASGSHVWNPPVNHFDYSGGGGSVPAPQGLIPQLPSSVRQNVAQGHHQNIGGFNGTANSLI